MRLASPLARSLAAALTAVLVVASAGDAQTTLAEFRTGVNTATVNFIGVRVPVTVGGSFDQLTFNFYSDVSNPAVTPSAAGTLFILDTEYFGTPAGLSAATAGFLAQSQGIVGGVYQFDPTFALAGGATYYLYANEGVLVSGTNNANIPGGGAYFAANASSPFGSLTGHEPNYRLAGVAVSAVPEPSTWALLGTGLLAIAGAARRRRATGA